MENINSKKKITDLVQPFLKKIGETPLEAIDRFRKENPIFRQSKIAYAGRLDPMAHGVLILLIGNAAKHRDEYQSLDKTYRLKILLGLETDTYDLMGLIKTLDFRYKISDKNLIDTINSYLGSRTFQYPPYSSFHVEGKPLFWWARNNKLGEIEIPSKQIHIKGIQLNKLEKVSKKDLYKKLEIIKQVKGDFRQDEILEKWNSIKTEVPEELKIIEIEAIVTSGTYMRTLATKIANDLGTVGLAFDIERLQVGNFK